MRALALITFAAGVLSAMAGAQSLQRMKLERRLAYLGTLGNNAPFIGLFGTVIGVMIAFGKFSPDATSGQTAGVSKDVMTGISEALVATAVGIFVAIPAVAFNNLFQRLTKATLANTEALTKTLLGYLKSDPNYRMPLARAAEAPVAPTPSAPQNRRVDDKEEKPAKKADKKKAPPPAAEEATEEES